VPSRKGYPLPVSDLASLFDAPAGQGSRGSITQMPILTMPNDEHHASRARFDRLINEGKRVEPRAFPAGRLPDIAILPSLSA
jgi:V/A-type H+-transporting ATPase subunit B